jgi:HSP20 family molecular chaperone IbpA
MKINIKKPIAKEVLAIIDLHNTVFGGSISPIIHTKENEMFYTVNVRVPSIDTTLIKIEITNNYLAIYQLVSLLKNAIKPVLGAHFLANFQLPKNADIERISTEKMNGFWSITIPKNQDNLNFHKPLNY